MKSYDVDYLKNLKKISDFQKYIKNFEQCAVSVVDKKILTYLKNAEIIAATGSKVVDEITNEETNIELLAYSDGAYIWDSRDIYYYENYGMPLNTDFVATIA